MLREEGLRFSEKRKLRDVVWISGCRRKLRKEELDVLQARPTINKIRAIKLMRMKLTGK